MAADGHLECLFGCGLRFSSLESVHLHIELDHREDNSISGFAVQEFAASESQPYQYSNGYAPPLPARRPSPLPDADFAAQSYQDEALSSRGTTDRTRSNHARETSEADEEFVLCSQKDCGELILVADLNDHLDFHDAQQANVDEDSSGTPPPNGSRKIERRQTEDDDERSHMGRKFFSMFSSDKKRDNRLPSNKPPKTKQRLGKAELGPHAFEDRMPGWMYKKLKEDPKVTRNRRIARNGSLITHESVEGQTNGVLPMLRHLVNLDTTVYKAYLCHPSVTQVGKRSWESGFCGFHNTQMTVSYIQNSKHPGHTLFPGYIPGILEIQDWIETAWEEGINEHAKNEFGGLRGTRKWIGTLEVDTLFQYMGIPHKIHQFHDTLETNNQYADQNLLDWVEAYFKDAAIDDGNKIQCTLKPPIYFQRPGHSLTIVGLERMQNGTRNLLVFDPMYQVPTSMLQLIERGKVKEPNAKLLRLYRRSQSRLYHYADFEATTLEGELPLHPAWDV